MSSHKKLKNRFPRSSDYNGIGAALLALDNLPMPNPEGAFLSILELLPTDCAIYNLMRVGFTIEALDAIVRLCRRLRRADLPLNISLPTEALPGLLLSAAVVDRQYLKTRKITDGENFVAYFMPVEGMTTAIDMSDAGAIFSVENDDGDYAWREISLKGLEDIAKQMHEKKTTQEQTPKHLVLRLGGKHESKLRQRGPFADAEDV